MLGDKLYSIYREAKYATRKLQRLQSKQKALKKEGKDLDGTEQAQVKDLEAKLAELNQKRKAIAEERSKVRKSLEPCVKWTTACACPYSMILAGNVLFAGGQDLVVGIDAGVSAKVAAANAVLRFVRRGAIISAADLMAGDIEALEIEIPAGAPAIGVEIRDLPLPGGAVIGAILRKPTVIVPRGDTRFEAGDRVVVLATADAVGAVERLFGG